MDVGGIRALREKYRARNPADDDRDQPAYHGFDYHAAVQATGSLFLRHRYSTTRLRRRQGRCGGMDVWLLRRVAVRRIRTVNILENVLSPFSTLRRLTNQGGTFHGVQV